MDATAKPGFKVWFVAADVGASRTSKHKVPVKPRRSCHPGLPRWACPVAVQSGLTTAEPKGAERMRDDDRLELRISDNAELLSLQRTLSLAQDTHVERVPSTPAPDALGAADYLTAIGSSVGLITLIKMLPNFLRARRADLSVEITNKDKTITVTAKNVDDVMPILTEILDE